jgi:Family of unknown function (DUF5317)
MLLLYAIGIGLLVGRAAGGRISALADIHVRWWGLAVGGLVFQVLLFGPLAARVGDAGPALYVASSSVVFIAMLRNLDLPGFPLLAVGAALNMLVVVANGGSMPSLPHAWELLNGLPVVPTTDFSNSTLIGPGTTLPFLADVFVLPRPVPLANVFSIGDVLIGIGAAWCVIRSMVVPTASSWRPASSDQSLAIR